MALIVTISHQNCHYFDSTKENLFIFFFGEYML